MYVYGLTKIYFNLFYLYVETACLYLFEANMS